MPNSSGKRNPHPAEGRKRLQTAGRPDRASSGGPVAAGGMWHGRRGRPGIGSTHVVSGPFTLWESRYGGTFGFSTKRYLLFFCLSGSARFGFRSFSFVLTPGSAAAVAGDRLKEIRAETGTVLLEYRPRDRRYHVCRSSDNNQAFLALPVTDRLVDWGRKAVENIRSGTMRFDRYDFCSVGVQLRDLSEGKIPYPYACAEGCPTWGRCAASAGCEPAGSADHPLLVTETTVQRIAACAAAVMGIGLWGGLLSYFLWQDLVSKWVG